MFRKYHRNATIFYNFPSVAGVNFQPVNVGSLLHELPAGIATVPALVAMVHNASPSVVNGKVIAGIKANNRLENVTGMSVYRSWVGWVNGGGKCSSGEYFGGNFTRPAESAVSAPLNGLNVVLEGDGIEGVVSLKGR